MKGTLTREFLLGGPGTPEEVLRSEILCAPLPIGQLLDEIRDVALADPLSVRWVRTAQLLETASKWPGFDLVDRRRLQLEAVAPQIRSGDLRPAMAIFEGHADAVEKMFPHVVRRAASYIADELGRSGSFELASDYLDRALRGSFEQASVGLYSRCWRFVHSRLEEDSSLCAVLERNRRFLAEAWVYLNATDARRDEESSFKGSEDRLTNTRRPADKVAVGLLLAEMLSEPREIVSTTVRWAEQSSREIPRDLAASVREARFPTRPPSQRRAVHTSEGAVAKCHVDCTMARSETLLNELLAESNDIVTRLVALRSLANVQRRHTSHENAWATIERAVGEARGLRDAPAELLGSLHETRALIALNTLRPREALESSRESTCCRVLSGLLDGILHALEIEGFVARALRDGFRERLVGNAARALFGEDVDLSLDWPVGEALKSVMAGGSFSAAVEGMESAGDYLYAAHTCVYAARQMLAKGHRAERGMKLEYALRHGEDLARRTGAQRLLLDVLRERAKAATTLPVQSRASLIECQWRWRRALTSLSGGREKSGAETLVEEVLEEMLERSKMQVADLWCNKDLLWAVQYAKGSRLAEDCQDRVSAERQLAVHLKTAQAIGVEFYAWGKGLTALIARPSSHESSQLEVQRVDVTNNAMKAGPRLAFLAPFVRDIRVVYVAPSQRLLREPLHALEVSPACVLGDGRAVFTVRTLMDLSGPMVASCRQGVWCYLDQCDDILRTHAGLLRSALDSLSIGLIVVRGASETTPVEELLREATGHQFIIFFCHGAWTKTDDFLELSAGRRLTATRLANSGMRFDGSEILVLACQRPGGVCAGERGHTLASLFYELGASSVIGAVSPIDARIAALLGAEYLRCRLDGGLRSSAWMRSRECARAAAQEEPDERRRRGLWSPFIVYGRELCDAE